MEMQKLIMAYPNLEVVQDSAEDLLLEESESLGSSVKGIKTKTGGCFYVYLLVLFVLCVFLMFMCVNGRIELIMPSCVILF